jgi:hypothetical protein
MESPFHESLQSGAGSKYLQPCSLFGTLENLGNFRIRNILKVAQNQRQPLLIRQLIQHLLQQNLQFVPIFIRNLGRLILIDQLLDTAGFLNTQFAEGVCFLTPDTSELVIALIDGNAVKPGEKGALQIEFRQRKIDFGKYLLRDVLDFIAGSEIVVGKVEDCLLIFSDQFLEGKGIPGLASADQFAVIFWTWLPHKGDPVRALWFSGYPLQSLAGRLQSGVLFAKAKTDIPGTQSGFTKKAAPRYYGNPDLLYEVPGKLNIGQRTDCAELCHYVIRASRN